MRLLLVDDSKILLDELSQEISNIEVVEIVGQAQDEAEALELFQSKKPEVVILDIYLKQGNGINILKILKEKKPSTIVIMLSNYPYPQFKRKCKALGADYFFDKLTEIPRVMQTLRELNDRGKRGNHEPKG